MTKQLYEEALADVKKVKEVAEANAQRAIIEAVTPRIRDLIERELLREDHDDDNDDLGAPGSEPPEGELMTDLAGVAEESLPEDAVSAPDEEGKVTLDLDALDSSDDKQYEMNLESISALAPIIKATSRGAAKELELMIYRLGEDITKFSASSRIIRESSGFHSKISQMISNVEDMYDYVQESILDTAKKSSYETKLEFYFKELNKLREHTMSYKTKRMMNEEDVTLKLTGLPDDLDLDSVGVDLITGEDGDGEGDDLSLDAGDEGGDEGGDMDLDDLDLGGDDGGGEDEEKMGENQRLSDDTVVEIDEGMLRREISRMRKLREEAVPSNKGFGVDSDAMDDFGGGSDEGEPLDAEIVDLSPAKAARPLGEADEDDDQLEELDQLDEFDDYMGELDHADMSPEDDQAPDTERTPAPRFESLKRRAVFEARLQRRAKLRANALKNEAVRARARKDLRKEATLKKEYATVARRFNESVNRSKKITKMLAESARRLRSESRLNDSSRARSAELKTVSTLRNKLAETNLINAKLLFTNKLLQSESLTSRQKAKVIEQLDSVKTVREAKLVYESLAKTLGGNNERRTPVNENARRVLGSSSRTTPSSSSPQNLNEGYEAERWARLAGIVK